jgi:hypothetical protein
MSLFASRFTPTININMSRRNSDSHSSDEDSSSSRSNSLSVRSGSTRRSSDSDSDSNRSDISSTASSERSLTKYHPEYRFGHGTRKRGSRNNGRFRDHRIQPYHGRSGLIGKSSGSETSSDGSDSSLDAALRTSSAILDKRSRDARRARHADRRTSSSEADDDFRPRKQLSRRRDMSMLPARGDSDSDTSVSHSSDEDSVNNQPRSKPSIRGPAARQRMMYGRNGPGRYLPPRRPGYQRSGLIGGLVTAKEVLDSASRFTGFLSRVLGTVGNPAPRRWTTASPYSNRNRQNFSREGTRFNRNNDSLPPRRTLGPGYQGATRHLQY